MKAHNLFTVRLFLFACLFGSLFSCQEEALVEPQSSAIEGGSYQPMAMVSLPVNQSLASGRYDGYIGNIEVPVIAEQGKLHFSISPALASGHHTLQVLTDNATPIAIALEVLPAKGITAPIEIIRQKAEEIAGASSQELFAELMERASLMTSAEQEQLAQFLLANPNFAKQAHTSASSKETSSKISATKNQSRYALAVGSSVTTMVVASEEWNETPVQLVAGARYKVEAFGTWTDWYIDCDADGYSQWHMVAFNWLKRDTNAKWFQLMGGYGQGNIFRLGNWTVFTAKQTATLNLFANDAWGFYWNNYGSLQVRITRVE